MTRHALRAVPFGFLFAACGLAAAAEDIPPSGFLCCNMRTNGNWISDINYDDPSYRLLPAGTPVSGTGYGRYRVFVIVDGTKQAIGNDYSRSVPMDQFARRYIVEEDPKKKVARYPAKVREAIEKARLMPGMTREQVSMAIGYPTANETPSLDSSVWKYWLDRSSDFLVRFDDRGRVKEVAAEERTKSRVVLR